MMCYNVLCDKYATRQMYGYCPSWALSWEYRKKGILDEIRHYSADIISLQVNFVFSFGNFCVDTSTGVTLGPVRIQQSLVNGWTGLLLFFCY